MGTSSVGANYVDERNTPVSRRARCIAATADLSASGGMFRYPDYLVHLHDRGHRRFIGCSRLLAGKRLGLADKSAVAAINRPLRSVDDLHTIHTPIAALLIKFSYGE